MCRIRLGYTYPLLSHRSFSNPLWIDWAIEDSIRSTYRTTKGAKVSRRCWWKRPFRKLSKEIMQENKVYMKQERMLSQSSSPIIVPVVKVFLSNRLKFTRLIFYYFYYLYENRSTYFSKVRAWQVWAVG